MAEGDYGTRDVVCQFSTITQKQIVQLITFSKHFPHTEPIFKSLTILPFNSLYYYRIVILVYELSNLLLPEVLKELYFKIMKSTIIQLELGLKYNTQTSTDRFLNVSTFTMEWNYNKYCCE